MTETVPRCTPQVTATNPGAAASSPVASGVDRVPALDSGLFGWSGSASQNRLSVTKAVPAIQLRNVAGIDNSLAG
ncbi:hypothetical protein GCM10018954_082450 [Kutzneria kofuensis]